MPSELESLAALVLAAGSSTRMGRNKLLLDWGGETLVRHAVRAAGRSGIGRVIVVLGHDEAKVRAELAGLACVPTVNPDHARGAGSSLRAGVRAALPDAAAVVVLLADMPFVTADMVRTLALRHLETGASVVVSRYGDVQAPPTLFGRGLFDELLQLPDAHGAREVARRHAAEAVGAAWAREAR